MSIGHTPLHVDLGAEVHGLDLSRPLAPGALDSVRALFEQYSVLLFRDQHLDDAAHIAFSGAFGELEPVHTIQAREGRIDYIARVGNVGADGLQLKSDHPRVRYLTGNQMWHSDSSFRDVPALASLLHAHEVPPIGGETEFVSMRAAYAGLSEALRERLEGLSVIHDFVHSRSRVGKDVVSGEHAAMLPPIAHPLVRVNPVTGQRNLYIGSHAAAIEGWSQADGRALLDDLMARTTAPARVLSHHWRAGDLIMWYNRCVLHRGRGYDADRYRRKMQRTCVAGSHHGRVLQRTPPAPVADAVAP